LGSIAIKGAVERAGIPVEAVDEVVMGNVVQAGSGANVARQAALAAGLKATTIAVTVNKVCASGMKAILIGTQMIRAGDSDIVVAGGTESMSNAPFYLKRGETPYGGVNLADGLLVDGLLDPFKNGHSGDCAENTAKVQGISRDEQDEYAIRSYKRAQDAASKGLLAKEIVPVTIPGKRGKPDTVITEDEEYKKVVFDKVKSLNPAFKKDGTGTITAANASTISDGAAAVVLASEAAVKKYNLKPLAKVIAYADAAMESIDFPIAPAAAAQKVSTAVIVTFG
jgi:acetyl-CoA C-acetyltransferase